MRRIDYIVVHCTAGSQQETQAALMAGFKARGWKTPGYHIVIDADGTEHVMVADEKISNGVGGHNSTILNVSYKGGVDLKTKKAIDNRTPQQKEVLLKRLKLWKSKYPKAKIVGHRDFSPDLDHDGVVEPHEWIKVCPCFDAKEEYKAI